jgi:hypothetical protein
MSNQKGSPPRKGPRWLAERITAGVDAAAEASGGQRLSRPEIDELVSRTLDEELERLADEKG